MKIVTVIGARPQFIKAAPVSREVRKYAEEIIIHTGQHYDANMSDIFFDELNIPRPDYNLQVGSGTHANQTGEMLMKIEEILLNEKPDYLLVYGDTNSTLAGALAAAKIHVPVVHVEAGLRSFNKKMPEEVNRIMTDHVSDFLFCPTETAIQNLKNENITKNAVNIGDVMYDAVLYNTALARKSRILNKADLEAKNYDLITVHRAENTDDPVKMTQIFEAFKQINKPKVWPLHPRTKQKLASYGLKTEDIPNMRIIDPVGYLDMLQLEMGADKILTDSGGVQKEAYFLNVPCITIREETEWVETLENGANVLAGADTDRIIEAEAKRAATDFPPLFGDGRASEKLAEILINNR